MDRSRTLVAASALAAGCVAVWVTVRDYRAAHPARPAATAVAFQYEGLPGAPQRRAPAVTVPAPQGEEGAGGEAVEASGLVSPPAPARPADALPRRPRKPKAKLRMDADARRSGTSTPAPRPAPRDPQVAEAVARRALALVGSDPDAETVWMDAINDPSRSAHERSDLIEDLNEDGFADPKHLTPDDLPLIERRLELIEQLAPDAMDDTNAAAFQEAYKDLLNMYDRAAGQAQVQ